MIRKLVIVRQKHVTPTVLGTFSQFLEGQPFAVLPIAWPDECDPSHHGYTLAGMKLTDIKALREWDERFGHSTVLSLGDTKAPVTVEAALASVGLRIHPEA